MCLLGEAFWIHDNIVGVLFIIFQLALVELPVLLEDIQGEYPGNDGPSLSLHNFDPDHHHVEALLSVNGYDGHIVI